MESVVNYLEDTEKKLAKEMADLFSKMREQRESIALNGIEDMYRLLPVEGVLYEPCVRIPSTNQQLKARYPTTLYYGSQYKLPQDETIVFTKETIDNGSQNSPGTKYYCIALTNYGRFIRTVGIIENRQFGGYDTYSPDDKIIKVTPLSYKLPKWFLNSFITHNVLYADPNTQNSILYGGTGQHPNTLTESLNNTTNTLQELNKEFYLFAGKWKPHMTEHATLDVDTMRQTIIDNTQSIEELKGKEESLAQQNKILQAELKKLKEEKAALEKEKTKLLPLEKYKDAVLEFMTKHVNCKKYKPIDSNIIDVFRQFHSDKVFMDSSVYNDVINSKEELNEYRIYKKVKGEMVSNGMDNSNVARNVKKVVNKLNS